MAAENKQQIVRLSGSCVRTVSDVTLLSTTSLTESDHLSIASLKDKLAGSNILRELKGSAFGQIQEVASRVVRRSVALTLVFITTHFRLARKCFAQPSCRDLAGRLCFLKSESGSPWTWVL
jgi:hypothetical protein